MIQSYTLNKPVFYSNNYNFNRSRVSTHQNSSMKSVSFAGWHPEPHNEELIHRGVKMIEAAKNIVIAGHDFHDGDAVGGSVGLARMIKAAYPDKNVVVISGETTKKGFRTVDPNGEIQVLKMNSDVAKYLKPDLFISVDVAERKLFNKLVLPVMDSAKQRLKICHHEFNPKAKLEDFNFADLNIVDTTLESASQLVMQFAKPLGLKTIDRSIAHPLQLGLITDTGVFAYPRTPLMFSDAKDLLEVTGIPIYKQTRKDIFRKTVADFKMETAVRNLVKFNDDETVAHLILGPEFDTDTGNRFAKNALTNLVDAEGMKHSFFVMQMKDGSMNASIRSRYKIKPYIEEIGGGGHDEACGVYGVRGKTPQEFVDLITKQLEKAGYND